MGFWHGVAATVALYLFCRWIAFIAPLGDPETGAGRQEFREGKERANVKRRGSNQPPPPPPKPRPPKNPPPRSNT